MTRLTTLFSTAFVLLAGSVASADTYDHFDRIAHDIERQATCLVRETRHFRHTPQYRHLVHDAVALMRSAQHAHRTARVGCDLGHLEADVREMDRLIHHIDEVVVAIERGLARGHGHAPRNARRVHDLVHAIEANIHHLWDDLRDLRRPAAHHGGRAFPGNAYLPYNNRLRRPSSGIQLEINRHHQAVTRGLNRNGISRRVPPGWGNSSVPRVRFGFGF